MLLEQQKVLRGDIVSQERIGNDGAGSVGIGRGPHLALTLILAQEQVLERLVLPKCRHQCQEVRSRTLAGRWRGLDLRPKLTGVI